MMTIYSLAAFAVIILAAFAYFLWSDRAVVRARRTGRRATADKVLMLASSLSRRQLWIALPYPKFQTDPKVFPEDWADRPRRWTRVVSKNNSMLFLEEGDPIDALGCEWYIYADTDGNALEFSVAVEGESSQLDLPPGIDPEPFVPSDVKFGS